MNRFEVGARFVPSYSFIRSQRVIQTFHKTAKNRHSAWNLAASINGAYEKQYKHFTLVPYDDLSMIGGVENHENEKYADELNLMIQKENLLMLRNALGLKQIFSRDHLNLSLDLAYVYEHIFSDKRYKAQFINTTPFMNFFATPQRSQFAKAGVELCFKKRQFQTKLSYEGLFSKKFMEQTAQIHLSGNF